MMVAGVGGRDAISRPALNGFRKCQFNLCPWRCVALRQQDQETHFTLKVIGADIGVLIWDDHQVHRTS
jgi:hypothetical protein